MELDTAALRCLVRPRSGLTGVAAGDRVGRIQNVARESGHLRLVVWEGPEPVGVVHVRDTLGADPATTAADLMRPVLTLPAEEPVYAALGTMRDKRSHLALVREGGDLLGLVTMQDLLDRLLLPAGSGT